MHTIGLMGAMEDEIAPLYEAIKQEASTGFSSERSIFRSSSRKSFCQPFGSKGIYFIETAFTRLYSTDIL